MHKLENYNLLKIGYYPQTFKIKGQIFFGSVPTMFCVSSLPDNRLNNGII